MRSKLSPFVWELLNRRATSLPMIFSSELRFPPRRKGSPFCLDFHGASPQMTRTPFCKKMTHRLREILVIRSFHMFTNLILSNLISSFPEKMMTYWLYLFRFELLKGELSGPPFISCEGLISLMVLPKQSSLLYHDTEEIIPLVCSSF